MTHRRHSRDEAPRSPVETDEAGKGTGVPVVGIGASAGGLAAAEAFFRGLPARTGLAFVVVQHLAPDHESEMAELLQNHTGLPVAQVEDGCKVEPDHVYTIPPGRQLIIEKGVLRLSMPESTHGHVQAPIDIFLRSLAADQGEAAACVILSGTGTDGTLGLKAVKEAGGVTLVQSPADAEYDGMPRSAVGTGLADITGPAGELAQRLVEFRRTGEQIQIPQEPEGLEKDGNAALNRIFANLRDRTGHDFSHYKRTTILRRLGRRMQVLGLSDLPSYLTYVRANPDEVEALFRDFLISVTNFFRDPDSWKVLEEKAIPRLFRGKTARDTVRAWVPGCATGEEAYSVAILLCEHASRLENPPQIQVFATDIDEVALAFAREAVYPSAIATDIPDDRLDRYFEEAAGGLRVRKSIREIVLFASHNVLRDAPFSRQDLITCRNLLIYLNREVQETVFELFHYALRNNGVLFLGSSESAEAAGRLFTTLSKRHRLYERVSVPSRVPAFPTMATADLPTEPGGGRTGRQERTLAQRHSERLLRERVPPTLLVDSDYQICHIAGGAHRFLREVDGVPGRDLLAKILPELRLDLRAALFQALQTREPVRTGTAAVPLDGEARHVLMEVVPVAEKDFQGRYAEVVFHVQQSPADAPGPRIQAPANQEVASQLEDELDRTRERLQNIIEEYETSNEELKASNEELQSMNEELRSTTEELETSKEELQSMNEELVTVNQELRSKIDELARANSDLKNLMAATEIGTIFLDREMRIKRYTPRAEDLFHLQGGDVGRPLAALKQKLHPHDLADLAAQVLRDLTTIEREQRSADGQWFLTRLRPYRTVNDTIEGVVITFTDITRIKEAEGEAQFQAAVLEQVTDAVFAVGLDDHVLYLNAAAAKLFGLDHERSLGRHLHALVKIDYGSDKNRAAAAAAVAGVGEWRGEVTYVTRAGRAYEIEASITALYDGDGDRIGSLKVLRDITDRKEAERAAREREQYLRTALRNVPLVAAIVDTDLRYRWIYHPHPDFVADEVIGKRDDQLDAGEGVEELMQLKREALHHQKSLRREIRFRRSDGEHIYDMTVDPLLDEQGKLVGLTTAGLDITSRKHNEEALRLAKREAEAANASKAAFLAAMSHELRTPLNAIIGYVDLMNLGVPDPLTEGQASHVARIRMSARHLLQLIEEILQFARVEAGQEEIEIQDVAVGDIVDEIRAIAEPLASKKGIELKINTDGAPDTIHADARKLRQILLNLVGNGVKFTERGRVEVRFDRDGEDAVQIHVIDTGNGMSEEEIAQIFEPFWQGDSSLTREAGGTGLGLTISQRYAEMMGAALSVRSAPGSGTAFTIRLPRPSR